MATILRVEEKLNAKRIQTSDYRPIQWLISGGFFLPSGGPTSGVGILRYMVFKNHQHILASVMFLNPSTSAAQVIIPSFSVGIL